MLSCGIDYKKSCLEVRSSSVHVSKSEASKRKTIMQTSKHKGNKVLLALLNKNCSLLRSTFLSRKPVVVVVVVVHVSLNLYSYFNRQSYVMFTWYYSFFFGLLFVEDANYTLPFDFSLYFASHCSCRRLLLPYV